MVYHLTDSSFPYGNKYPLSCCFLASRRSGSDDSQERLRPHKRARKQPVYKDTSSPEGSHYEEEMEYEEWAEYAAVGENAPKLGMRKPSYMPPPPPNQPPGDTRHIYFEPPPSLGCEIKDFTLFSKPAYLKFCRDVDQFFVSMTRWILVFVPMFRQTFSPRSLFLRGCLLISMLT